MLMMVSSIESTRQAQYGLESIDGYCEGWGEIDQLADISSQVLSSKYPYMGPIRVSWWKRLNKVDCKLQLIKAEIARTKHLCKLKLKLIKAEIIICITITITITITMVNLGSFTYLNKF